MSAPFRIGSTPLASFGTVADPDPLLLGDILDAVLLPQGGIAVLDDKLFRLRLFSQAGQPTQSLGREGQGPGEFARRILALASDSSGTVYVADLSRSVKVFTSGPDGYRYSRTIPLGLSAQSMCVLGPLLVVTGSVADKPEVLHSFRLAGSKVNDFGTLYTSPNLSLNLEYNRSLVACDQVRGFIYLAAEGGFGEIRAYRATGGPVWRTSIAGFRNNVVVDIPNGYRVERSPSGVHTVYSMTLLPGRGLLVQVAHRTPDDLDHGSWFSTLTSFLLDPSSGKPALLGTTIPPLTAATATRALLLGDDPVPHFSVHTLDAP